MTHNVPLYTALIAIHEELVAKRVRAEPILLFGKKCFKVSESLLLTIRESSLYRQVKRR